MHGQLENYHMAHFVNFHKFELKNIIFSLGHPLSIVYIHAHVAILKVAMWHIL
jgi:hypothetical protein